MRRLGDVGVQESLSFRIAALRPDSDRRWGRMSAHQMVCHLNDSFLVCLGEKDVSLATGPIQRSLFKWMALYFPAPWPKNIPTRPEVKQGAGGTCPTDFDSDRDTLLKLIKRFCNGSCEFREYAHPFFGKMRDREWLRWAYLHVDHHLRQFGV
jgi:Protein of unknown function (DUF1569)